MQAGVVTRFVGGETGLWRVEAMHTLAGPPLPPVEYLQIERGPVWRAGTWCLSGIGSNLRYTTRSERDLLQERQEGLGRPDAICAALIPIRKTAEWWEMAQDEREAIMRRARHTPIGAEYLPAVARKLYHSRDLSEPFDFLTWFEFAASAAAQFDELLGLLRASVEWDYVEQEVELRLIRIAAPSPVGAA